MSKGSSLLVMSIHNHAAGAGGSMFQAIPTVEFRIGPAVSILTRPRSSSFKGDTQFAHRLLGKSALFTLLQTNPKIGGHIGHFGWQAYIEEDMLTWEGPGILFYLVVIWSFKAPPLKAAVSPKKQFPTPRP